MATFIQRRSIRQYPVAIHSLNQTLELPHIALRCLTESTAAQATNSVDFSPIKCNHQFSTVSTDFYFTATLPVSYENFYAFSFDIVTIFNSQLQVVGINNTITNPTVQHFNSEVLSGSYAVCYQYPTGIQSQFDQSISSAASKIFVENIVPQFYFDSTLSSAISQAYSNVNISLDVPLSEGRSLCTITEQQITFGITPGGVGLTTYFLTPLTDILFSSPTSAIRSSTVNASINFGFESTVQELKSNLSILSLTPNFYFTAALPISHIFQKFLLTEENYFTTTLSDCYCTVTTLRPQTNLDVIAEASRLCSLSFIDVSFSNSISTPTVSQFGLAETFRVSVDSLFDVSRSVYQCDSLKTDILLHANAVSIFSSHENVDYDLTLLLSDVSTFCDSYIIVSLTSPFDVAASTSLLKSLNTDILFNADRILVAHNLSESSTDIYLAVTNVYLSFNTGFDAHFYFNVDLESALSTTTLFNPEINFIYVQNADNAAIRGNINPTDQVFYFSTSLAPSTLASFALAPTPFSQFTTDIEPLFLFSYTLLPQQEYTFTSNLDVSTIYSLSRQLTTHLQINVPACTENCFFDLSAVFSNDFTFDPLTITSHAIRLTYNIQETLPSTLLTIYLIPIDFNFVFYLDYAKSNVNNLLFPLDITSQIDKSSLNNYIASIETTNEFSQLIPTSNVQFALDPLTFDQIFNFSLPHIFVGSNISSIRTDITSSLPIYIVSEFVHQSKLDLSVHTDNVGMPLLISGPSISITIPVLPSSTTAFFKDLNYTWMFDVQISSAAVLYNLDLLDTSVEFTSILPKIFLKDSFLSPLLDLHTVVDSLYTRGRVTDTDQNIIIYANEIQSNIAFTQPLINLLIFKQSLYCATFTSDLSTLSSFGVELQPSATTYHIDVVTTSYDIYAYRVELLNSLELIKHETDIGLNSVGAHGIFDLSTLGVLYYNLTAVNIQDRITSPSATQINTRNLPFCFTVSASYQPDTHQSVLYHVYRLDNRLQGLSYTHTTPLSSLNLNFRNFITVASFYEVQLPHVATENLCTELDSDIYIPTLPAAVRSQTRNFLTELFVSNLSCYASFFSKEPTQFLSYISILNPLQTYFHLNNFSITPLNNVLLPPAASGLYYNQSSEHTNVLIAPQVQSSCDINDLAPPSVTVSFIVSSHYALSPLSSTPGSISVSLATVGLVYGCGVSRPVFTFYGYDLLYRIRIQPYIKLFGFAVK